MGMTKRFFACELVLLAAGASACGGLDTASPSAVPAGGPTPDLADAGSASPDAPATAVGLEAGVATEASAPVGPDGTPTPSACTNTFGNAVTPAFGRLDGYLVAVVPASQHGCNADASHLHLQVKMQEAIYDVAITLVSDQSASAPDVFLAESQSPLGNGAWAEGWHPGQSFDYVQNLGLHAASFASMPKASLRQKLETTLAGVNHVSIYATGYGPSGAHKVHRNGRGADGAIVLQPTSSTPHVLAFHFSTQSF